VDKKRGNVFLLRPSWLKRVWRFVQGPIVWVSLTLFLLLAFKVVQTRSIAPLYNWLFLQFLLKTALAYVIGFIVIKFIVTEK
jgi:hypothetical protein